MGRIIGFLFVVLAGLQPAMAGDEAAERQAILDVVERTFEAVAAGDPEKWRAVLLEAGVAIAMARPRDGTDGFVMRLTPNKDVIEGASPPRRRYLERFTEEPTVLIRGPIAVVWGEYDFWIDQNFSHCGVDAIDLVKLDGAWKVANIMWTVERQNCPTAEGPAPQ